MLRIVVNIILILIGGFCGILSWLICGVAISYAWWLHGPATATVVAVVVGKLTTPLWMVGVTKTANKRWPAFHRFMMKIAKLWKNYYPSLIIAALWVALFVWAIFLGL